jgi:uncharacterized LabA/DUF88 family protein
MEKNTKNQKVFKADNASNNNILPGDRNGSPDESFNPTLIFSDAGFVSNISRYFGNGRFLIYDIAKFANNLARKEKLFCKDIFYYTAPPFQSDVPTKQEEKKREGYDKFAKRLREEKVIVREGRCQKLKVDGKEKFHQKAVDILMAMDLMKTPLKYPEVKRIILIASDSDFVPIIKSLEDENIKTILYTFYQKKRNAEFSRSNHLIKAVYKYKLLTKQDFDNSPLK